MCIVWITHKLYLYGYKLGFWGGNGSDSSVVLAANYQQNLLNKLNIMCSFLNIHRKTTEVGASDIVLSTQGLKAKSPNKHWGLALQICLL